VPSDGPLLTFGEAMGLVTARGIGTLELVSGFGLTIGGSEGNVAVGAARLGAPVVWIGRVGQDAVGDLIARRLGAEPLDAVVIRDRSFTGLMVRHARTAQTVHVDYHRAGSAGSRLSPADIPADRIRDAGIVHFTGITPALSDSARCAVLHVVDSARSAGVVVSMDVNYRRKLWRAEEAAPVLRALVRRSDVVFAGVAEAQLVTGTTSDDRSALARQLTGLGPAEVVIKDGAHGCTAIVDDELMSQPAVTTVVVDPVGAGDAFVAGYLAERLTMAPARRRLETAVAMGAYAASVPGDCELLPTRAELDAFLADTSVIR